MKIKIKIISGLMMLLATPTETSAYSSSQGGGLAYDPSQTGIFADQRMHHSDYPEFRWNRYSSLSNPYESAWFESSLLLFHDEQRMHEAQLHPDWQESFWLYPDPRELGWFQPNRRESTWFQVDTWHFSEIEQHLFGLSSNDFLSMTPGFLHRDPADDDQMTSGDDPAYDDSILFANDVPIGNGVLPLLLATLGWTLIVLFRKMF